MQSVAFLHFVQTTKIKLKNTFSSLFLKKINIYIHPHNKIINKMKYLKISSKSKKTGKLFITSKNNKRRFKVKKITIYHKNYKIWNLILNTRKLRIKRNLLILFN